MEAKKVSYFTWIHLLQTLQTNCIKNGHTAYLNCSPEYLSFTLFRHNTEEILVSSKLMLRKHPEDGLNELKRVINETIKIIGE